MDIMDDTGNTLNWRFRLTTC